MKSSPPAVPPPRPAKHRVFVVDDHHLMRRSIVDAITRDPRLTVCGQAEDAPAALAAIAVLQPDLVVTDIELKDSSGLDLIKILRAQTPALPIVAASMFELTRISHLARQAGATEFIAKQHGPKRLVSLLHEVLQSQPTTVAPPAPLG